jgi:hypothetical protein
MDFPKGLYAISKNCRDLLVKQNFPSIQNPNGEMPKTKVGEFFKLYNIALGPNSKTQNLHLYTQSFEQKLDLNYFCPKSVILKYSGPKCKNL